MTTKPNIVVLISGSGSNLQALIDAVQSGELEVDVGLVVSNRKAAYGLVRAAEHNIPTVYHPLKPYREAGQSREQYEADLAEWIRPLHPDLIVLAGWMHVFGAEFLNQFPHKVINLHPALPGQFGGTHAIERAYAAYQQGEISHSGCMVHLTIPEVDAGPVITQANVPLYSEDSMEQFAARMHSTEHRILVEAVRRLLFCDNVPGKL